MPSNARIKIVLKYQQLANILNTNTIILAITDLVQSKKPLTFSMKEGTTTATSPPSSETIVKLPKGCFSMFFEYETPKVVTVQNVPLGILRLLLQTAVVAFVVVYQLWYAKGYQEFAEVEASITTKMKGFSM